jgi:peptidoglycan/LPS O-acetylase OafA/YrhL
VNSRAVDASPLPRVTPPLPRNLPTLTSFRFLAALIVVSLHVSGRGLAGIPIWTAVARRGSFGVDFFFILSGFILCHAHRDSLIESSQIVDTVRARRFSYREFLSRRLAKIVPLNVIMAVLFLLHRAGVLGHGIRKPAMGSLFVQNIAMVQSWGFSDSSGLNTVAWSVSAEFFVYLCFPVVIWLMFRGSQRTASTIGGFMIIFVLTIQVMFGISIEELQNVRLGLLRIVPEFIIGALLYRLVQQNPLTKRHRKFCGVLAITCFVLGLVWNSDIPFLIAFVLTVTWGAENDRDVSLTNHKSQWHAPWLLFLGETSYALYMTHFLFLELTISPLLRRWPVIATSALLSGVAQMVILLSVVGIGSAVFVVVERPLHRRIIHRLRIVPKLVTVATLPIPKVL